MSIVKRLWKGDSSLEDLKLIEGRGESFNFSFGIFSGLDSQYSKREDERFVKVFFTNC